MTRDIRVHAVRAASVAVLLALAACTPAPQPNTTRTETPPARVTATQAPDAATAAVAPPQPARVAARPDPQPKPEPVNDDPDQFLGQSGVAVAQLLGPPVLIRRDGPAEVWQYRGSIGGRTCALDVFLYGQDSAAALDTETDAPAEPDGLEVRFVDLRGAAASSQERRACLAAMIRAQQSAQG